MILDLKFRINKKQEQVFDYLINMDKFTAAHPVIYKMETTERDNYLVYETLQFGPFPFSFTYPVAVTHNQDETEVNFNAVVFGLNKINMKFVLEAEGEWTTVHEQIQFASPLPIKSFMRSIFKKQHQQLFENIGKA